MNDSYPIVGPFVSGGTALLRPLPGPLYDMERKYCAPGSRFYSNSITVFEDGSVRREFASRKEMWRYRRERLTQLRELKKERKNG
jgi:hypothetical protein